MNNLSDEDFQAFFDKLSDEDLEKIESLAQAARKKRRKKKKWVYGGETYTEIVSLYDYY